jgi:hypothetical protein
MNFRSGLVLLLGIAIALSSLDSVESKRLNSRRSVDSIIFTCSRGMDRIDKNAFYSFSS